MTAEIQFETLLVPVDFSDRSRDAFERAAAIASGEKPIVIVLHVINPELPAFAEAHQLGTHDQIVDQMRKRAHLLLEEYQAPEGVEVDVVVSMGPPFLEILKKAKDFAVDAIVMSKVGHHGQVEGFLFGSTAEKVIRGSTRPVLVLPAAS